MRGGNKTRGLKERRLRGTPNKTRRAGEGSGTPKTGETGQGGRSARKTTRERKDLTTKTDRGGGTTKRPTRRGRREKKNRHSTTRDGAPGTRSKARRGRSAGRSAGKGHNTRAANAGSGNAPRRSAGAKHSQARRSAGGKDRRDREGIRAAGTTHADRKTTRKGRADNRPHKRQKRAGQRARTTKANERHDNPPEKTNFFLKQLCFSRGFLELNIWQPNN
jgi:hypothetical protein